MKALEPPRWLAALLAVAALPLALAGCDDPSPPHAMTLVQAASSPDADPQQARAAFAGTSLHEYLQLYFGEPVQAQPQSPPGAPSD